MFNLHSQGEHGLAATILAAGPGKANSPVSHAAEVTLRAVQR